MAYSHGFANFSDFNLVFHSGFRRVLYIRIKNNYSWFIARYWYVDIVLTTVTCLTLATIIFNTWFLIIQVNIRYLHRHLICYIWYLIYGTWYLTLDTWYLTLALNMLSPGISSLDLILWHLTGYYYTRHLYFLAYSWLSLLRGLDYYIITKHLVLLNSCIPEPLKKGDSWYYTHVDPRNRITMNIWLLWTPCGHYNWTNSIIRQLILGWGKLMSTNIVSIFMMIL